MKVLLAFAMLCFAGPAAARFPADVFHGVEMGMEVDEVRLAVTRHCVSFEIFSSDQPYLPVAAESQGSLVAHDLELADGSVIATVSFVFADGRLVMIEATGGVEPALMPHAGERAATLGRWGAHLQTKTVFEIDQDHAWILSDEALHPHLFLWSDPQLRIWKPLRFRPSAATPDAFRFGDSLDSLRPSLEAMAMESQLETIEEPWLPTHPSTQQQLNLYGIVYAGFLRKAEVVFGDGRLELVWILTGKGEEERVRERLIAAHGEPVFVSDEFEAFAGWRVALRKDKPEVLLLSDQLAPVFEEMYGSPD